MRSMDSQIAPVSSGRRAYARSPSATSAYPLLAHDSLTSILAWQGDRARSVQEFLQSVWGLAGRLPTKRYAINVCKDRYQFAVGFAAALVAQQISLLPTCRAEEPLHQLAQCYSDSYVLTDHDQLETSHTSVPPSRLDLARFRVAGKPCHSSHPDRCHRLYFRKQLGSRRPMPKGGGLL